MQKANHCKRWDGKRNFHSRYAYENNKQHKQFTKGSLVRTLPSYGRMSRGCLVIMSARREELGCRCYRRASWEAAQSRLREEVAERRGSSSTKKSSSPIPPSIHPSTHLSIHSFVICLVTDSLIN